MAIFQAIPMALLLHVALASSPAVAETEEGKTLFDSLCASCHGTNGDGNGPQAEELLLKPRDFALAAFKFDTDADWQRGTDADLANVIRQGTATYGGSPLMPAWQQLSDTQVESLVHYIRGFR